MLDIPHWKRREGKRKTGWEGRKGRKGRNELFYFLDVSVFNVRLSIGSLLVEVVYDVELLVRTQNDVYTFNFRNLIGLQLGIAANHSNKGIGIDPLCTSHQVSTLLVGVICDLAGVDDIDVWTVIKIDLCITSFFKKSSNGARF